MHGLVCIFCMGYWKRLGLASWQTSSSSSWSRSWQGMCPTCLFRSKQAILRCRDMTVAAIFLAQTLRAGVCLNRLGWDSWQTSCGSAWNRSWRVTWPASRRRTPRKPSGWPRQPLARPCCTPSGTQPTRNNFISRLVLVKHCLYAAWTRHEEATWHYDVIMEGPVVNFYTTVASVMTTQFQKMLPATPRPFAAKQTGGPVSLCRCSF